MERVKESFAVPICNRMLIGGGMPRIKRCKLSWKPSDSDLIVGYRLYWSNKDSLNYDCGFVELGNVQEIFLPDAIKDIADAGRSVTLGISAVDNQGNESDITKLAEPYQAVAPPAPVDLLLTVLDEFNVIDPRQQVLDQFDSLFEEDTQKGPAEPSASDANPQAGNEPMEGKVKYYDDLGYRKLEIGK